jgi:hypothetical protein
LKDLTKVVGFFVRANCASSSPLRTAVIKMSMTKGILLSDGMAIPFLPFSKSIGLLAHAIGAKAFGLDEQQRRPLAVRERD